MRKLKGGMRGSKLFDTRNYLVVRLVTKAHLHPRCRSTHKEYCFTAIKYLPWTQSRSPWSRFPLRSFTKKRGGLHVPRTKMLTPLHTKTPRMAGTPSTSLSSSQAQHTRHTTLLSHSNLSYPSTLTYKACARPKDLITKHFGWLGGVFEYVWDFSELQQLQNGRGEALI